MSSENGHLRNYLQQTSDTLQAQIDALEGGGRGRSRSPRGAGGGRQNAAHMPIGGADIDDNWVGSEEPRQLPPKPPSAARVVAPPVQTPPPGVNVPPRPGNVMPPPPGVNVPPPAHSQQQMQNQMQQNQMQQGQQNPMMGQMGQMNPMMGQMGQMNPMMGQMNPMMGQMNPMAMMMGQMNPMAMMMGMMNPMMMGMMNNMMGGSSGSAGASANEDPEETQRRLGQQVMKNTMAALRRNEAQDDVEEEDVDEVPPGPSPNVHHPNYRPADMEIVTGLTDRRFEGIVKLFVEDKGFGFIACEDLRNKYPDDVFLHHYQRRHFVMGDSVSFNVFLNFKGRPQATELRRRAASK